MFSNVFVWIRLLAMLEPLYQENFFKDSAKSPLCYCLVMALFNHHGHCLQLQLVARPPGRQEFVEIEPGLEPKYPRA